MLSSTPLRYPGGKTKIFKQVKKLIETNFPNPPRYCEGFMGGAGLSLKLLFEGVVSEIHVNDLDDAIYSFWVSCLDFNNQLVRLINETDITIDEWHKQKTIYQNPINYTVLEKGFSTLFLNRTNRSGIMIAGPIGGKKQDGNYKLDCRFKKKGIIDILNKIYDYRDKIHVYNLDAKDFIAQIDKTYDDVFIYLDPPYISKGPELYKNSFKLVDHEELKETVAKLNNKWFITYDDHPDVERIYGEYNQQKFNLTYTADTVKKGTEIAIFGPETISVEI